MSASNIFNTSGGVVANQAGTITYNGDVYYDLRPKELSEEERILYWLAPTGINYIALQHDYLKNRQPKTGEWFFRSAEYQTWVENTRSILFCTGMPGAGKTILTSIIIDHLTTEYFDNSEVGIAFIYFNYKRVAEQNIENILLILLKQLAQGRRDSLPDYLKSLFRRHQGGTRPSRGEIVRMIRSLAHAYTRTFIIMDALDECQPDGDDSDCRSVVLEELFGVHGAANTNINILATSRPVPEISLRFTTVESMFMKIRASDEDVERYLDSKIERSGRTVLKKNSKEIKAEICKMVDGMFLLAKFHFEAIKNELKMRNITRILEKLAARKATGNIAAYDSSYEDAMIRVNAIEGDAKVLALRALEWITCAKRPLTTEELQHALAVDFDLGEDKGKDDEEDDDEDEENILHEDDIPAIEDLMSLCSGLIAVDEESDIIRLVHYTTQEYFERTWTRWFPKAHQDIALACLTYMSYNNFRQGPVSTNADLKERYRVNALYRYAAQYWSDHIRTISPGTEGSKETVTLVLNFLQKDNLRLSWVQAKFMINPAAPFGFSNRMLGIHAVAFLGLLPETIALVEAKADLEAKDEEYGQTALSWAAEWGHAAIVKLLLESNADIETRDSYGRTPLSWAVENGHEDVIKVLLEAKADTETKDSENRTLLLWAAKNGRHNVAKLLTDANADTEAKDDEGLTPLMWAVRNRHKTVVKLLIGANADLEVTDSDRQTPLLWAARNGHKGTVKLLIDAKANLEVKDKEYGQTALAWAVRNKHENTAKLLIEAKANIEITDSKYGQTPLLTAVRNGHEAMIKILIESEADKEAKDRYGQTALSYAMEYEDEGIIKLLRDYKPF